MDSFRPTKLLHNHLVNSTLPNFYIPYGDIADLAVRADLTLTVWFGEASK